MQRDYLHCVEHSTSGFTRIPKDVGTMNETFTFAYLDFVAGHSFKGLTKKNTGHKDLTE